MLGHLREKSKIIKHNIVAKIKHHNIVAKEENDEILFRKICRLCKISQDMSSIFVEIRIYLKENPIFQNGNFGKLLENMEIGAHRKLLIDVKVRLELFLVKITSLIDEIDNITSEIKNQISVKKNSVHLINKGDYELLITSLDNSELKEAKKSPNLIEEELLYKTYETYREIAEELDNMKGDLSFVIKGISSRCKAYLHSMVSDVNISNNLHIPDNIYNTVMKHPKLSGLNQ